MSILVLNAGSSTLKFGLFDDAAKEELAAGVIEHSGYDQAVAAVLKSLTSASREKGVMRVGHRVVHGGDRFRASVRIDGGVLQALRDLEELAPLHMPPAIHTIEAAQKAFPSALHAAVFDTAYFAALEPRHSLYPVPYEWFAQWGIRRFGFHGISYAYCVPRAAEILGRNLKDLNIVACHLGNGCSAAAVRGGIPVTTTMGFTPLEGLMMGTRSGSIDPGILLYVQQKKNLAPETVDDLLNHQSGLKGVSGISEDVREITRAADQGHARARLALTMYADRIRSAIGALAVTLGRVDALVFTAGAGEHDATLRSEICQGLDCLGITLDTPKNAANQPDSDIAAADSKSRVLILHTREELLIAQEMLRIRNY